MFEDFEELATDGENIKPLKKIWGNFILEACNVLFPSERGVGKTFFMLQIAVNKLNFLKFLN